MSEKVESCLVASPEEIYDRVAGDSSRVNRPLLEVADPKQRIIELLDERGPDYARFTQLRQIKSRRKSSHRSWWTWSTTTPRKDHRYEPTSLTWTGVTARRMARHPLTEPATDVSPADIAGVMCGAHAQVLSAAEFSIGRRIAGATRADVQRALWEERTLVKTFGPRGTVHLLPTADLPMWTGALSALPPSVPMHPEPVRFTPEQADEVIAAIGDSLADAELTVDELTEAIVDRTGRVGR